MPTAHELAIEKSCDMDRPVSIGGRARHFARKYIAHGRLRLFLGYLIAKFQAVFIQPTILPYFVTFFPYHKSSYWYKVPKSPAPRDASNTDLPTPPDSLMVGYGPTINEWLATGIEHVGTMRRVLAESGYAFEP